MYIAGYNSKYLRVINNPDENYTFSSQTVLSNPAYALTYYMPMQKVIKSLPPDGPQENVFTRTLKEKVYELTDHLGNVRAVVSDEKHVTLTAGVPGDFEPDVIAGNNYYAFGMLMPGRSFRSDEYRYGFQGQEKDDEVKGNGNQYDYGFRIYDPRIAKFLSRDPLFKSYPFYTPYQYAANTPIWAIDLDGLEAWTKTRDWEPMDLIQYSDFVTTELNAITAKYLEGEISKHTFFDCADIAVHLIINYAAEQGLPISFTDINGNEIRYDDVRFNTAEGFEDQVRGFTNVQSLTNDTESIVADEKRTGDMNFYGTIHLNLLRDRESADSPIRIPTISGNSNLRDSDGNFIYPLSEPFGGVPMKNVSSLEDDSRQSSIPADSPITRFKALHRVKMTKIDSKVAPPLNNNTE